MCTCQEDAQLGGLRVAERGHVCFQHRSDITMLTSEGSELARFLLEDDRAHVTPRIEASGPFPNHYAITLMVVRTWQILSKIGFVRDDVAERRVKFFNAPKSINQALQPAFDTYLRPVFAGIN
ncbi:hypothetical protein EYF80_011813 [Liparis tanakae]|uniref:Uncharacterized protein n=1 Tax=Liparis tanakae TaxID=230148 RepID=A0A4Z2IJA2_9TELE|nr:hypothetical protein EYF80_011813 [Liparis tanakae]